MASIASPPFSPDDDDDDDDRQHEQPARKRQRLVLAPWAQLEGARLGAAVSRVRCGAQRRSQPVQDLRDALDRLKAAEEMKAAALQTIQRALPKVEEMVQQSTRALDAHADFCPSLCRSQASDIPGRAVAPQSNVDNQSACKRAAGNLWHALRNNTLFEASASAAVSRSGNELCCKAGIVFHRREQLESTLSAHSSDHNSRRSLCLRVLSIDYLRVHILGNLSLRKLWSLRRVCREFSRWCATECRKLHAVPFCNQSAYGGISMVNPGNLTIYKLEHWAEMKQDAAIACGNDGSIYRAGGFMREGMGMEADPVATSSVDVWRPRTGQGGGSWQRLPNMRTARTHARACVVQMTGGGEALVVVGGRARRMSNDDFTTVEVLRLTSAQDKSNASPSATTLEWTEVSQHLPTRRRGFAVVACGPTDHIAVVGGEARTSAAVVAGVVVDAAREALRNVEILDLTTGRWLRAPDLRRPRINPRVATDNGALYVVGGSSVPGPSQLSGEHVAMCERLPALRPPWPDADVQTESESDSHSDHTTATAAGGTDGVMSCGNTDPEWAWSDIGEIPRPEAYAAMKLQVQICRKTLLCVQPAPSGAGHLVIRKDSAYIFDLDSRTWHCKAEVERMRV